MASASVTNTLSDVDIYTLLNTILVQVLHLLKVQLQKIQYLKEEIL